MHLVGLFIELATMRGTYNVKFSMISTRWSQPCGRLVYTWQNLLIWFRILTNFLKTARNKTILTIYSSMATVFLKNRGFNNRTVSCINNRLLLAIKEQIPCVYLLHLGTYLLTPWSRVPLEKLTGFAANQEIPRILWNPKVHYRTHSYVHLVLLTRVPHLTTWVFEYYAVLHNPVTNWNAERAF